VTAPALVVRLFIPSDAGIRQLWSKYETLRSALPDECPSDALAFGCWISATNAIAFTVHPPDAPDGDPLGLFVYTDIEPGSNAMAHIFIWNRPGISSRQLVTAAQASCAAMFRNFRLRRITGLTPATLRPAITFAHWVGFKYEGRLRNAIACGGTVDDGIVNGLLPDDLETALNSNMVEEEERAA
jgi:RimJ/RimL family protein N-acetyltransferase